VGRVVQGSAKGPRPDQQLFPARGPNRKPHGPMPLVNNREEGEGDLSTKKVEFLVNLERKACTGKACGEKREGGRTAVFDRRRKG